MEAFLAGKLEGSLATAEKGGEKADMKFCTRQQKVGIGKRRELYEVFMEYDLWDFD